LLLFGIVMLTYLYPIPLIFGYNIQLTSLFLILAISLLGRKTSVIIALLVCLIQWQVFDQALIVWLTFVEILFLTLFKTVRVKYMVIDVAFWLFIGSPLILLLVYLQTGHMNTNSILLIFVLIVNGLSNALIAELILAYTSIRTLINGQLKTAITFRQILFHLGITAVIIPFVVFAIIIGWYHSDLIAKRAIQLTSSIHLGIQGQLQNWESKDTRLLQLHSLLQLGRLQEISEKYVASDEPVHIKITDNSGYILVDTQKVKNVDTQNWKKIGEAFKVDSDLYLWLPEPTRYYDTIRWDRSYFIYHGTLPNQTMLITIEIPLSYFAKDIYHIYTVNFALILASIVVAALICWSLSRLIIHQLMKLIHSTAKLPEEVKKNHMLSLQDSPILEVNWLRDNFEHIAHKLSAMFAESDEMNSILQEKALLLSQSEERLTQLAFTDNLTQLPNRNYLMQYLQHLEEINDELSGLTAFLFIDLDDFKNVNDIMGHAAGDDLLKYVAKTFTRVVSLGTVCRLAGDEFVIILTNTSKQEVDHTCESILSAFSQPVFIKQQPYEVKVSIGIAIHPLDNSNFENILNLSDKAMYKVKSEGGCSYVYYSNLLSSERK
jgi:diguanylate cyclase (GGDEF)-like protein